MAGSGQSKANNEGVNMLARVMQERMRKVSSTPDPVEFGEIQGDYSLMTNQFPIPIPRSDYFVGRQLTLLAEPLRPKPGDHVIVVWIGADPVVVDVIVPATEVG